MCVKSLGSLLWGSVGIESVVPEPRRPTVGWTDLLVMGRRQVFSCSAFWFGFGFLLPSWLLAFRAERFQKMAILGFVVMNLQSLISLNADSLIKDSRVASLRVKIVTWRLPAMATSVHLTLKGFDQLPVK